MSMLFKFSTFTPKAMLVASFWAFVVAPCLAAAERLDDSASPRNLVNSPPMVSEFGLPLSQFAPGRPEPQVGIVNFGRIDYKLATSRYVGKAARIYYVVPALIPGLRTPAGLKVEWRGNGIFSDGSARPGERALVWSGVVRDAFIAESLTLTMRFQLRELQLRSGQGMAFESYFEIEASP